MKTRYIFTLTAIFMVFAVNAAAREYRSLNRGWCFYMVNERDSVSVTLPHTWNSDVMTPGQEYYRGTGNYIRYIDINPEWRGKRVFLKFNGSSTSTELLVNGRYVGGHNGGNNAFAFEITDFVDFSSRNLVWVKVSNAQRSDILPTASTENIYGGLFRDVELVIADRNVIGFDEYGSDGIMITTQRATKSIAECRVKIKVNASVNSSGDVSVTVYDSSGVQVARNNTKSQFKKGMNEVYVPVRIDSPRLWNGTTDPYIYTFAVELLGESGGTDRVEVRSGLRKAEITGDKGFLLNGEAYELRGVVLHRDRALYGPVSLPWQIDADLDIIQDMGANAVRVACGTHSQHFYDECDRRGIVVINDSPFVGAVTLDAKGYYNTDAFKDNARKQTFELIAQNFNHPSIVAWNIFVEPEMNGDDPLPFIRQLNGECKALDPTRATSGCSSRDGDLNTITDAIVWNHVLGWVSGFPADISIWRNQLFAHPEWRKLRSAVSYRCGGDVKHQSARVNRVAATDNWHPESYQSHFHEVYVAEVVDDSRFWGVFVGDMFDFGSAVVGYRGEPDNIDDCGLVTFDRVTRKDAFYLYKAIWNTSEPFVYITERRLSERPKKVKEIRVYSNQDEVELFVNGESQGVRTGAHGVFKWSDIELAEGTNEIGAVAGDVKDSYRVNGLPSR